MAEQPTTNDNEQKHPVLPGRTIKGRFTKGNKAGKGNNGGRPKAYAADYLEEFKGEVSMAQWRGIVAKAVEQALNGEHRARTFIASYILGQPVQQVVADVSGTRDRLLKVMGMIEEALPEVGDSGIQSDLASE
jgi:hypothetical protein